MFHYNAKKLINAYLDDELAPGKKKQLEKHIQSCERCRKELEEFKKLDMALDIMQKPEERTELYWQTLEKNIMEKSQKPEIEPEKKPLFEKSKKSTIWKVAMSGSTVIVLIFAVWFGVYHLPEETVSRKEIQSLHIGAEPYYVDTNLYPQLAEKAEESKETPARKPTVKKLNEINRGTALQRRKSLNSAETAAEKQEGVETDKFGRTRDLSSMGYGGIPLASPAPVDNGMAGERKAEESDYYYSEAARKLKDADTVNEPAKKPQSSLAIGGSIESRSTAVPAEDEAVPLKEESHEIPVIAGRPSSEKPDDREINVTKGSAHLKTETATPLYGEGFVIDNKPITLTIKDMPVTQALETIATTANIKVLVISPQLEKQITTEFQSEPVEKALRQVGDMVNLRYLNKNGETYILSPQPIDLYTGQEGYASSTNEILFFDSSSVMNQPTALGLETTIQNTTRSHLCPVCQKIELRPEWTYCPIDGSKIDKSIFTK